jgi:ribose transport system permease protein
MSDGSQAMAAPGGRRSWPRLDRDRVFNLIQKWGLLVVLGLVVAGFSIWIPSKFATQANFKDILNSQPPSILIAFAAIFVLMAGEFDLSLGATLGFCQYFVLKLMTATGLSWPLATIIALLIGAGIGLVNAGFVVGLGINSFIATIGMATVLDGLLQWVSHGSSPIFSPPPQTFQNLAQKELGGIALPVIYALGIALLFWMVTEYTVVGRELRATGANRRAAQLSGLRTKRSTVLAFVSAGLLSSLGGILITARVGAADATSGPGYLLPAYAAAFLGATAIKPGLFNVWGTVIAIFLVAVGITGLQLNGADAWVTPVFNGVVLLLAVTVSMFATRRRAGESTIFTRMRARRGRAADAAGGRP